MTQTTKLRNRSDAALKGSSAALKLAPGSDAAAHQFASQLLAAESFRKLIGECRDAELREYPRKFSF